MPPSLPHTSTPTVPGVVSPCIRPAKPADRAKLRELWLHLGLGAGPFHPSPAHRQQPRPSGHRPRPALLARHLARRRLVFASRAGSYGTYLATVASQRNHAVDRHSRVGHRYQSASTCLISHTRFQAATCCVYRKLARPGRCPGGWLGRLLILDWFSA